MPQGRLGLLDLPVLAGLRDVVKVTLHLDRGQEGIIGLIEERITVRDPFKLVRNVFVI